MKQRHRIVLVVETDAPLEQVKEWAEQMADPNLLGVLPFDMKVAQISVEEEKPSVDAIEAWLADRECMLQDEVWETARDLFDLCKGMLEEGSIRALYEEVEDVHQAVKEAEEEEQEQEEEGGETGEEEERLRLTWEETEDGAWEGKWGAPDPVRAYKATVRGVPLPHGDEGKIKRRWFWQVHDMISGDKIRWTIKGTETMEGAKAEAEAAVRAQEEEEGRRRGV